MSGERWPVSPLRVARDDLAPDERAEADALLLGDPAFRAEVERLRGALRILERVEARAARGGGGRAAGGGGEAATVGGGEAVTGGGRQRLPLRARRRVVGTALALTVIALALAAALLAGHDPGRGQLHASMLLHPVAPRHAGGARLTVDGRHANLAVHGLPINRFTYYEAWLATPTGRMASLGIFRVGASGTADVHLALPADLHRFATVDVTLQADDGTTVRSTTSVLRAAIPPGA